MTRAGLGAVLVLGLIGSAQAQQQEPAPAPPRPPVEDAVPAQSPVVEPAPQAEPPPPARPTIREITFAGNDTTRPSTMLREMVVEVGDPADPKAIERSRQGIQDLGLFKKVTAEQVPLPDGGVRVVFTVVERWYVLPLPRYDVNSEGERGYGLQLRWFNVWGLNHSLRTTWSVRDEKRQNTGDRTNYNASYDMPFIFGTEWRPGISGGHTDTPVEETCDPSLQFKQEILDICAANGLTPADQVEYTEQVNTAGIGVGRSLGDWGPASVGWSIGADVQWSNQSTRGALRPQAYGEATAFRVSSGFKDLRNNIYSEQGRDFGVRLQSAAEGLGSDYSFNLFAMNYAQYWPVGEVPHQTVHLFAGLGTYHGGPTQTTVTSGPFALGGASELRGYPGDYLEGDAYYYVSGEYVRPVYFNWLRVALIGEAGNVFPDLADANLDRVYASVGLSLRLRFTFLVDLEVEAGIAMPLDGNEQRFFASKV